MDKRRIDHIYWFAYYNLDSPSVRYRAKYPLDFIKKKENISSRLIVPGYSPRKVWNFLSGYISALLFPKKNSLIVIQRVQSNFIYASLLKLLVVARSKDTVYDLDDADYLEQDPQTIHFFARKCNRIAAGSPAIARYLTKFNKNVVHISSPTPDLKIVKRIRNKTFNIGWIGGFGWGHKNSLYEYLFPALKELPFDCCLTLTGIQHSPDAKEVLDYFKDCNHINVTIPANVNWKDETSIQKMIMQFDVGIATLLNHPLQLAKSGIKAKQYMNCGIPVICNNLPENNNVVVDGYNGFVCDTYSEFKERLIEFGEMNDTEYFYFSENARKSIKNFDLVKWHKDFEYLTRNTLKGSSDTNKVELQAVRSWH
ncbi:MAG: glycosyltransferase [Bacteroidales bacterium]|nr:glycosyltransferase [Bacteroidales bacterium]